MEKIGWRQPALLIIWCDRKEKAGVDCFLNFCQQVEPELGGGDSGALQMQRLA